MVCRTPLLRFGPFELDLEAGELFRNGRLVRLPPQPVKVLARLLATPGAVVTRDELQRELWGQDTFVDFDQGLNTCIRQIRAALGDHAESARYVQTLQRRGYRFVAPVEAVERTEHAHAVHRPEAIAPAGEAPAVRPEPPHAGAKQALAPSRRSLTLHRAAWGAAALVSVVALAAGWFLWAPTESGIPQARHLSLLVLPLTDLSPNRDQAYLAEGFTEAIIAELGRFEMLRVISRTSAMHYQGTRKRLAEIARELSVDAVIEGSVAVADGRVRLNARLIDGSSDTPIWTATYDRELRDALVLQQEIARAAATEIRVQLGPTALSHESRRVDPEALHAYLRGRHLWNQRTTASLRMAVEHFQSAIRQDPLFADAYAALAATLVLLSDDEFGAMESNDSLTGVRTAARRALELDPSQAEAWAALATAEYTIAWNPEGGEEYFQRAVKAAPGNATVWQWYGWFLISRSRFDDAASAFATARNLDPLSPIVITDAGYPDFFARRYDTAIPHFRDALAQDPNFVQAHVALGRAYLQMGRIEEARQTFERAAVLSERSYITLTYLAMVSARAGAHDRAHELLQEIRRSPSAREYVSPFAFVFAYAALGELDSALDWLERAVASRTQSAPFLHNMPELDPLRTAPRFVGILNGLQPQSAGTWPIE
jgi:TolB-like protein/DNA-binding winged helix-turn-helix (wHTH) protein/Tfp pilus assembly protein PilF